MEDYLALHPPQEYKCLDDGFVRLVDMMPRMVPIGRTPDFSIVRNARVSIGLGLKDVEKDRALLRYLYLNQHSTPFESVIFTFHLRLPRFVATHFHRHRTSSINEFSQRYAKVKEDAFFHPSAVPGSLRKQNKINQQSSSGEVTDPTVKILVEKMEQKIEDIFKDYQSLLNLGVSKEVARSFLPLSTYTEMYFTINLRNLLHLLELRYDQHTQKETRDYAEAIYKILEQTVPETIKLFNEFTRNGMHLSETEITALAEKNDHYITSTTEKDAFQAKKKRLEQI